VAAGSTALAEEDKKTAVNEEQGLELQRIKKRLDMLDERLDNMDSVITAAVERVMNQPVAINMTCPHCGKNIYIAIMGSHKPKL
jgi:hypothetical protein